MVIAALTACSIDTSTVTAPSPTSTATADSTATPAAPVTDVHLPATDVPVLQQECTDLPERTDLGARENARGEVAEGDDRDLPAVYLIAAGDSLPAIADRFCMPLQSLTAINAGVEPLTAGAPIALTRDALD